jgi:MYXO-CTERM domain-containing protein
MGKFSWRRCAISAACALFAVLLPTIALAQPVKNRISVLVDSSGSMLLTPEIVTFPETCAGVNFNGCTGSGNPSVAQETCNACVADTIHFRATCASNWTAQCRTDYTTCYQSLTGQTGCAQALNITDGISTRGDGSVNTPGCDLNGDGQANDSRMSQAKGALGNVLATFGEVEFSLWRYNQTEGGQTCVTNATCPKTASGLTVFSCESVAGVNRCVLNSSALDSTPATVGQCNPFTWNGAAGTFDCSACDFTNTFDRALCESRSLNRSRTGAVSLLNGTSTVNCALPTTDHRFVFSRGAGFNNNACDPTGAERLVAFPATGFDDNYNQIASWIDGVQTVPTDNEITAQGGTPIAASIRDMKTSILADLAGDRKTPCRKYQVIVLTDGGESCESVAAAVTAAASLRNLSFTNPNGVAVSNYNVDVYVIGFAICPPGQPNCQTAQDLNSIAAAGGTTKAFFVNNQLQLQATLSQIVASSVVSEKCNGLDDDCDSLVDEGFSGLGAACSAGVGTCQNNGIVACTADQLGVACNAVAGSPGAEVCNLLDDNCNGLVDDGISCQGCAPSCSNADHCDICNGRDEDCDGRFDEDFAASSCGVDTGECTAGTTRCTAGVLSCSGSQGPVSEACNGLDDDCDGTIDGMSTTCYPAATVGCNPLTGVCAGVCKLGVAICNNFPSPLLCNGAVTPGTEVACNLQDDDCDGLVDEGQGAEQCNGLDDDCDGKIDEGVAATDPDLGVACGTPPFVGECRQGAVQCILGAEVCVGEVNPGAEVCDNRDNNCDGSIDNNVPGFGGACGSSTGECTAGVLTCNAGAAQCVGGVGPVDEICDSKDNNCNGAIDETDPRLGDVCTTLPNGTMVASDTGECRFGVLACTAGALTCVGTIGPATEQCNIADDDCDGNIDEDFPTLGTACNNGQAGVCLQNGTFVCAPGGAAVTCTALPGVPGVETCNTLDDDCDGRTDEAPLPLVGTECASGVGTCAPGLWECRMGTLTCGSPGNANPEICNGADDDCDGSTDEAPVPGTGEMCVAPGFEQFMDIGACEFGATVCSNGGLRCEGYQGPSPEICDGIDNDCDGVVDDTATCPDGNVCYNGACAAQCGPGEFPCGAGFVCKQLGTPPVGYCVNDTCLNVTCPSGFSCDQNNGQCKDLCDGITCRAGEVCRSGFCLDCFDLPSQCAAGELCVADGNNTGQCVDNKCDPNPCPADSVCSDGVCSSSCSAGCPPDQACIGGSCVQDLCNGVRCGRQVCDPSNGTCVDTKCTDIRCNPGEVCVPTSGVCEPDPCSSTICPTEQVCRVDGGGRAVCEAPNAGGDRVTAAGGGCATGNNSSSGWWLIAAMVLIVVGRRRAGIAGSIGANSLATIAALVLPTACRVNPYDLGGQRDDAGNGSASDDANGMNSDGNNSGVDAAIDAPRCLPQPERCNSIDDDCDTKTDEGFNLQADPNNCGVCGTRCTYSNAVGTCTAGTCGRGACNPGYHDNDNNPNDCEYFCIATNGGVERCDDRDNNCDGIADEGFNKQTDVNNCGLCGNVCSLLHASAACNAGACVVAQCDAGFVDVDPAVPGCEYRCSPSNGGVESCDGVDNNCDGVVDDGNPGGGASCGTDTGQCTAGSTVCSFGVLFCVGSQSGGQEVCDNLDNNCDGAIDDGFNKQTDPQHCGSCSPCAVPNAVASCSAGACGVASCRFGFFDIDGSPGNGCEYSCINTGAERCDDSDNNCNGIIDEGFNKQTDASNCGTCGRTCSFANAGAVCNAGSCQRGTCNVNFFDLNGDPTDGCEYGCILSNGGVEKCDGQDNNCNGVVDEGNPGGNVACGTDTGECTAGLTQCIAGNVACVGSTGPGLEVCDNLDNDCDSQIDDGFNKLTDPQHCGSCSPCTLDHAIPGCAAGSCTVAACLAGFVNLDGNAANGCEYGCTFSGQEVCDGIDNDCDGLVDAADPTLVRPPNFCRTAGECAGTTPTCAGAGGWDCVYTDPDVELDGTGHLALEETRCDGKDNDCDGGRDEVYPLKGTACDEDGTFGTARKLGVCRGVGSLVCNGAGNGLACNITTAGTAASSETCDNKDNDCDGHLDEPYDFGGFNGVRDAVVGPLTIGGNSVTMYKFEASRPDATATSAGFVKTRSCSTASKMPWASGNLAEVQAACSAAGMRLCGVTRNAQGLVTVDEWGRFCEGAANRTFPYGNSYGQNTCNGSDFDPIAGGVNEDVAVATGSMSTCVSQDLSFDQSGNLKEWVNDPRSVGGQTVYTLRGGSFDNYQPGLTCDFDLTVVAANYTFDNLGFRCCSLACPAGQVECGGACIDLSTSASNCGTCGNACTSGNACSNGYCCPTGTRACGDRCVANATVCP